MGILDTLKAVSDVVNSTADSISKNTVEDFGTPEYSLLTVSYGTAHRGINIVDEAGNLKYTTEAIRASIKGKVDVLDANDEIVAHLEKSPVSLLHGKRFVTLKDGRSFTLSNKLFDVVEEITNIEELGWQLKGNFIGLHFNLVDAAGGPIATVSKKAISLANEYKIDIYRPSEELAIVAIVIQLERMLEDKANNNNDSSLFRL